MQFNKSRDGVLRATVRCSWRVSKDVYDWLAERVGGKQAEKLIRDLLYREGDDGLCWRRFAFNPETKEVEVIHVDDRSTYEGYGREVSGG